MLYERFAKAIIPLLFLYCRFQGYQGRKSGCDCYRKSTICSNKLYTESNDHTFGTAATQSSAEESSAVLSKASVACAKSAASDIKCTTERGRHILVRLVLKVVVMTIVMVVTITIALVIRG